MSATAFLDQRAADTVAWRGRWRSINLEMLGRLQCRPPIACVRAEQILSHVNYRRKHHVMMLARPRRGWEEGANRYLPYITGERGCDCRCFHAVVTVVMEVVWTHARQPCRLAPMSYKLLVALTSKRYDEGLTKRLRVFHTEAAHDSRSLLSIPQLVAAPETKRCSPFAHLSRLMAFTGWSAFLFLAQLISSPE